LANLVLNTVSMPAQAQQLPVPKYADALQLQPVVALTQLADDRLPPTPFPQKLPEYSAEASRYHWTGLLVQSFEFNVIEDAFRMGSDNMLRSLLVTKPFWHDYFASLGQFNMRRWNDGDDFLVNYIGHPLQGSVTGYLEIQNSSSQSRIQWNEPGYWPSRGKAFLWATVFSTYEEIGPTGEAGIGSEGGFTYDTRCVLHCKPETAPPSGRDTNNTGWVDFIVTPTAGMLWLFAEDLIDKEISGRIVQHAKPNALVPKIIRGSLNPSRTMANFLRGRKPWYRDWDYPAVNSLDEGYGMHFLSLWEKGSGELEKYPDWRRIEIAPHSTSFATTVTTQHCQYCVRMTQGAGVQVSVELWKYLYADTDVSYQAGASPLSSDRAGGDLLTGFFGVRLGKHWPLYAINLSIRPGFLHWNNAYESSVPLSTPSNPAPANPPQPTLGSITHFAWNAMLAADYKFNQHVALRAGINETLVRYRNACLDSSGVGISAPLEWLSYDTPCQVSAGIGKPPYLTFLSHEDFVNRGSWGLQFGPVFSF
jgi:hypothetical protein